MAKQVVQELAVYEVPLLAAMVKSGDPQYVNGSGQVDKGHFARDGISD